MMIEALISMARYLQPRLDDDLVDRMNYHYTPSALLMFSVLISFKQFGGRPLECMFPNKFPGSWEQYAENYCWSEDTYYLPPDVHVASVKEEERYDESRKLSYYQWVPFFLMIQAACFHFPSFLWKCLSLSSGIRVDDIVRRAIDPQTQMDDSSRQHTIEGLARHISRALRFQKRILHRRLVVHKHIRFLNLSYSACFISYMYLVTKLLYLGNVFAQLYLMNRFLETDTQEWYGLAAVAGLFRGVPWSRSGYFPRVSLCDFMVRQVGNIQKYSVQCVLVINIFNEKIFILLWLWYTMLLIVTALSFLYWLVLMLCPCFGRWFVGQNLELNESHSFDASKNQKEIANFVHHYLKQDGIFVLRMVSLHAGILFSTDLIMYLYKLYYGQLNNSAAAGSKDGRGFSLDAGTATTPVSDGGIGGVGGGGEGGKGAGGVANSIQHPLGGQHVALVMEDSMLPKGINQPSHSPAPAYSVEDLGGIRLRKPSASGHHHHSYPHHHHPHHNHLHHSNTRSGSSSHHRPTQRPSGDDVKRREKERRKLEKKAAANSGRGVGVRSLGDLSTSLLPFAAGGEGRSSNQSSSSSPSSSSSSSSGDDEQLFGGGGDEMVNGAGENDERRSQKLM